MINFQKKLSTYFYFLVNKSKSIQLTFIEIFKQYKCLLCGNYCKTIPKGSLARLTKFCPPCLNELPFNQNVCRTCALPFHNALTEFTPYIDSSSLQTKPQKVTSICGECLKERPPFTQIISPFCYQFPIDAIIHELKYRQRQYWVKSLCPALISQVNDRYVGDSFPDVLIPIPLHPDKEKLRGYNQAELISQCLSRSLDIQICSNILRKIRSTRSQTGLNKNDRIRNLKNSFIIKDKKLISKKHIALIDDVVTTKATAELCSKLLLASGASRVDIWCIARTPKTKDL